MVGSGWMGMPGMMGCAGTVAIAIAIAVARQGWSRGLGFDGTRDKRRRRRRDGWWRCFDRCAEPAVWPFALAAREAAAV